MTLLHSGQCAKLPATLRLIRQFDFPRKLGLLERLFGGGLQRLGIQWVRCQNGVIWKLDLGDKEHRWIVYGQYEGGAGINYARSVLKNGGVYVDSGANIGQWLLSLGSLPQVTTLAIEPVATQCEWLRECVNAQTDWQVEVIQIGLGAGSERLEIQVDGARSTLRQDWYEGKALDRETIQLEPLDQVLEARGIDAVSFWKLDVEGAEYQALQGARNSLAQQIIETLYFECHPSNYESIVKLLRSAGYSVYQLAGDKLESFDARHIDCTLDLVAKPG
ncbi:MAG: FkbM family methyltransferase [Gammaproteobacteria bacterium]|nr:FkbM family methyltransferase [Gammaproteobacteria bacterium]